MRKNLNPFDQCLKRTFWNALDEVTTLVYKYNIYDIFNFILFLSEIEKCRRFTSWCEL